MVSPRPDTVDGAQLAERGLEEDIRLTVFLRARVEAIVRLNLSSPDRACALCERVVCGVCLCVSVCWLEGRCMTDTDTILIITSQLQLRLTRRQAETTGFTSIHRGLITLHWLTS